jgi:hypothetical protein
VLIEQVRPRRLAPVALVCHRRFRDRVLAFFVDLLPYILLPLPAVNPVFHSEFIRSKEFAPNTLAPRPRWCSTPPGPIAQRS